MRQELQILPMVDYPIVRPLGAEGEIEPEIPPQPPAPAPSDRPDAAKLFLVWGAVGVLAGAVVTMGVTALSFHSFKRTKSIWVPTVLAGGSALVTGALLLLVMRRALSDPTERNARWLAFATGANAAT